MKVQYPDIANALKADLDNLGAMVSVVATTTRMVHGKAYYAELRDSMMEELDYRLEAKRARQFDAAAAPLTEVQVPRCFEELTAEKVLTLELLPGPTLKEFLNHLDEHSNEERFKASRLIMRAVWGPLLLNGTIHSDPHPGNFLLLPDGKVGVLDFGAIKQMSHGVARRESPAVHPRGEGRAVRRDPAVHRQRLRVRRRGRPRATSCRR